MRIVRTITVGAMAFWMVHTAGLADSNIATQTIRIIIQPALFVGLGISLRQPRSLSCTLDVPAGESEQQTLTMPLTYSRFAGGESRPQITVALDEPLPAHMRITVGGGPSSGGRAQSVLQSNTGIPLGCVLDQRQAQEKLEFEVVAERGAEAGTISRTMTLTVTE